jgi:hypothetical protein
VTDEDTPVDGQLQAYDTDSPALTYIILGRPSHGSLTAFNSATGEFTYLPSLNYAGADQLAFRANDGLANSNNALVSITVNPINDPPVARDTVITAPFETAVDARFQAYDIDGPSFTFTMTTGPLNGIVSELNANTGTFTYTPATAYFGPDSIKFTADDGSGPSNTGTVRINVSSSNCVCACWADPHCNGELNVIDLVIVIQILFENRPAANSLNCPPPDADFNCDCFIDIQDFAKVVDLLFAGDEEYCNPCTAPCN